MQANGYSLVGGDGRNDQITLALQETLQLNMACLRQYEDKLAATLRSSLLIPIQFTY